ncbi:MAG: homoserine dehydrogenase [Clostridiales bacterium]|nr:homoserine dehydrogenase [Clostridiales bacterium]
MEADKKIRVAILGSGTVGTGVYKIIQNQKDEFPHKIGSELEVAKILVRNINKQREGIPSEILTDKWADIINDDSIGIVIEVMGGIEPAKTYISEALANGKHVVTANKDLMAEHGHELLDIAAAHNCDLLFEAAVAGGIPIIRPIKQCLAANKITEIMGIINGTTNFILTKMTEEGMEFEDALKLATELGYAEADPTADIEGLDAGRKIAILASIAFNSRVSFSDVYTEGISKITAKDIKYAKELGCVIKLIATAKNTETGIEVRVTPMFIPVSHPLASVNDSFNAVFVHGDALGDTMFYGRGAGELPTASAVMGDVIDVCRNTVYNCNGRIGCTCYKNIPIKSMDNIESKYFVSTLLENKSGTLGAVANTFAGNNASIDQMVQKNKIGNNAEVLFIIDNVKEKLFLRSIKELSAMHYVKEISSIIRVHNDIIQ